MKCFLIMPYGNGLTDPTARQELDALHDHIREAVETITIDGRARFGQGRAPWHSITQE